MIGNSRNLQAEK